MAKDVDTAVEEFEPAPRLELGPSKPSPWPSFSLGTSGTLVVHRRLSV
jgi:hypothetical protein